MAKKPTKPRRVRRSTTTAASVTQANKASSTGAAVTSVAKVKGTAKAKANSGWQAFLRKPLWVRFVQVGAVGFGSLLAIFLWYAKDLPSPNKVNATLSAQTTKLYDRTSTHVLVEIYGDKNRSVIEFDQMPQVCKDATVAVEDKNFYKHGAFSPAGIARAFSGVLTRTNRGGGSTITQQYVKNALLTDQRSYSRKIKELILAIEIEQLYNKDDILKLYLNEIPYGSTAYGLQAAAKTYFSKDAKDLDLSQCAMLAAMPQAPTYYSPYGLHKDALIDRQHYILGLMAEQGFISKTQATAAENVDILAEVKPQNLYANVFAPHFVGYVRAQLEDKYGIKKVNEGGLKVVTTLDYDKQVLAEKAVADNIASVRKNGGSNAALVAEDPTNGQMLSMVGSYDYSNPEFGSYNVAAAERQPGSSFKPITYSTLFKKNWGPGSTLYDVPTDFGGGYKPVNYTHRNYGVVSIRQAFSGSLNIPAVKALYLGGIQNALDTAKDLGITTLTGGVDRYGLSLTLGTGEVKLTELVNAYATFPRHGDYIKQLTVLKITESNGNVVEDNTKASSNKPKRVLDPQIAYLVSSTISDNTARCSLGTFSCRNPLTLGNRPVAAKTGTTDDFKDAWTMGYTTRLVAGVWAGNNDNTPMTQAASIISAPIWNQFMTNATKNDAVEGFTRPAGIKEVTLDADTGKVPTTSTKHTRKDLFPSWYKAESDTVKAGKIDKVTGKLATSCTPPDAIQDVTSGTIRAEIPPTDPSFGRWNPPVQALATSLGFTNSGVLPSDSDTMHSCSDSKPRVSLTVSPTSGSTFTLKAHGVNGTFPINNYIFYFDGNQINAGGNDSVEYTPPAGTTGQHSFSVKVYDTALYTDSSESVNVSVVASTTKIPAFACSASTCLASVTGAPSGTITAKISYNGGPFGNTKLGSGPNEGFSWTNFPGGSARVQITDSDDTVLTKSYP